MKNRGKNPKTISAKISGLDLHIPHSSGLKQQYNIVDILKTDPSDLSFLERVEKIGLSSNLVTKIQQADCLDHAKRIINPQYLSEKDEKELAAEVLLARHKFTCLIFDHRLFRQAALSVIQNIYLFQQRKIFFSTSGLTTEQERQEALLLFSQSTVNGSIPLAKSFQHLVLARVWYRINSQIDESIRKTRPYIEIHEVVEQLNTLRNIYMLLSLGLTYKLTRNVNAIYQQSITCEDAYQIGTFGIARAAYRYHPSSGIRFSTYASRWILKELQRQALDSRLIRISANLVEQISREAKNNGIGKTGKAYAKLCSATAQLTPCNDRSKLSQYPLSWKNPNKQFEKQEIHTLLLDAIDKFLSPKSGDVILRRYGLGPYHGKEFSVIEIAKFYNVTRGSIYQLEQTALKKLKERIQIACPI